MNIQVWVNEKGMEVDAESSVFLVRDAMKNDADIMILNGFPIQQDVLLQDKDRVILIKRGEIPCEEELESLMTARHTPGVHEKVKNAKVGIAGLGGLGSNIAIALARIGVGKLILVDFDIVEPSNLNRQQYFIKHIGMPKTEALKELLALIHPYIRVEIKTVYLDEDNIGACFGDTDIVVEAFDNPKSKACLVNTMLSTFPGRPIVAASGLAGYDSNNAIKTKKVMRNLYVTGDGVSEAAPGCGLMAPRVLIAAGHQANMVLRLILGEKEV